MARSAGMRYDGGALASSGACGTDPTCTGESIPMGTQHGRPAAYLPDDSPTALVLGGGGARAAYQVGVLRGIARRHPDLRAPILTGTSAGAINAAFIASRRESFGVAVSQLVALWESLTPEHVFRVGAGSLARNVVRWGWRLVSGGLGAGEHTRGLVDTAPLLDLLRQRLGPDADGAIAGIE